MKTFYYLLTFLLVLSFSFCRKMDDNYKHFVIPEGKVYPGIPDTVFSVAGDNRIEVSWINGSDPNIRSIRVFWNNNTDSVEMQIPEASMRGDTLSIIIENLSEGDYTFSLRTYDDEGHISIPVEFVGSSFGDGYRSRILARPANSFFLDALNNLTIDWGVPDLQNGAAFTEVRYKDSLNEWQIERFSVSDESSVVKKIVSDEGIEYRTLFIPDSVSIDTFYTEFLKETLFSFDKKDWSVVSYSSQHSDGENAATNLIDGTYHTRWHTHASQSSYPHWIIIDMGTERTIQIFGVQRTDFDNGGDDRGPDKFQLLGSNDSENWSDLGTFDFDRNNPDEQLYSILNPSGYRYFQFIGLSGPQSYMVVGEVSAYGF